MKSLDIAITSLALAGNGLILPLIRPERKRR